MTKGTYHAIRRGEEWLVVFERAAEPMWLQVVARFRSEKRAECYADVENDMFDDDPADQWQADTRIAVPTMPEPASLIRAEWIVRPVTGALTARVETVTFGCEGPAATKHENPADLSTDPMSQNPATDEGEFDPPATAEEITPQPKETAPDQPASKPEGLGAIDLRRKPESREAVWRAVAEIVKEGRKPTYAAIAAHADMSDGAVKTHVLALVADGTLKRIGERRTATLEVLRWPDGMEAGAPVVEPEPTSPATTTPASASVMDTFHAVAAEGDVPVRTMAGVSFADTLSDTRKAKFRDMWNDPRSTLASIAKAFGTIPEDAIATAHAMNLSARKGQADKSMKGLPHDPDQVAEFLRTRGVTRIETTAPPRPAGVPAMPTNPRRSI